MKHHIGKIIGIIAFLLLFGAVSCFLVNSMQYSAYNQEVPESEGNLLSDTDDIINLSAAEAPALPGADGGYIVEEYSDTDTNEETGLSTEEENSAVTSAEQLSATPSDLAAEPEIASPSDMEDAPAEETPAQLPVVNETPVADAANASPEPDNNFEPMQFPPENIGDFCFAYFDIRTEGNVKAQVNGLVIRLLGVIDSIDPVLLSDVVLTKDGVPVSSSLSLSDRKEQYQWMYEDITDFFFTFNEEITEPGMYSLTGKYNGELFSTGNKYIEEPISDTPADPAELRGVTWCFFRDKDDKPISVNELAFMFNGEQHTFYQQDLTELVITLNGEAISYSFMDNIFRYFEYNDYYGKGDTRYHFVLNQPFTQSGTYVATGKYKGVSFETEELTIP